MYTTRKQVRQAFWQAYRDGEFLPLHVTPRKITNYAGNGKMHNTDTRCCWTDWIDGMSKDNQISQELAQRATLDP